MAEQPGQVDVVPDQVDPVEMIIIYFLLALVNIYYKYSHLWVCKGCDNRSCHYNSHGCLTMSEDQMVEAMLNYGSQFTFQ